MKNILKISTLFVVGLLFTTTASAYYVDNGVVRDSSGDAVGDYLGHMGNANEGLPASLGFDPNWIGTHQVYDAGSGTYYDNLPNAVFSSSDPLNPDVHWYTFTVDTARSFKGAFEWGIDVATFSVDFFLGSDEDPHFGKDYTLDVPYGHLEQALADFPAGSTWFLRVTGTAYPLPFSSEYKFLMEPVPLPPAVLLFISALVGLGVVGRKNAGTA